jgi:hypothetical protein
MLDNPKSVKKEKEKKRVTISIYKSTKERLENYGRMGFSYDDVLNTLMDIVDASRSSGTRKSEK